MTAIAAQGYTCWSCSLITSQSSLILDLFNEHTLELTLGNNLVEFVIQRLPYPDKHITNFTELKNNYVICANLKLMSQL